MKKKNILVFPCGSEIGLEIYNSVKYSTYFHLIGGSSVDDHGKYVYEDYIGDIPFLDDEKLIKYLNNIVEEKSIDAIYPTMDAVITKLKKSEKEIGCKIIAPDIETVEICLSKEKTYNILKNEILIPEIYKNTDDINKFPVFIKPKIGYGARGTKLIYNKKELENYLIDNKEDNLILENLPGEEYTVDCFSDKNGRLRFYHARKRNRIRTGISVNTTFVDNQEEFEDIVKKVNTKIRFRGAWFIQLKRNINGELSLLEVAARLGGSSSLCRGLGINLAQMTLFDAFNYDVDILENNYKIVMDRALDNIFKTDIKYNTVYVDYDDCIVLDKTKVNIEIIQFLFKSLNEGKRIILISKHEGDLNKELEKYRIKDLFDEVIHLDKEKEKKDFIIHKKAIYIDDSFAERKKIHDNLQIPVFDVSEVKVLL